MGRKKPLLDQINVIDLEATCWDGEVSVRPSGAEGEIIEIGLSELDPRTGHITQADLWMICPTQTTVSEFCTQLTTWTQEDVDKGVDLSTACTRLRREFSSQRRIFASWGNYDRRQFERECNRKDIPNPFGPSHLNVKDLFALKMGLTQHVNTMQAMEMIDMEPTGTWHVGRDDAYNIARVLAWLLNEA